MKKLIAIVCALVVFAACESKDKKDDEGTTVDQAGSAGATPSASTSAGADGVPATPSALAGDGGVPASDGGAQGDGGAN